MHVRVAAAGLSVGAALLALASACSSFDSTPDPASPDATPVAPDAAAADAGIDAKVPCPANAFCDDFERDGEPELGWSTPDQSGGTLSIVPDDRSPGGRSLAVTIPASNTAGRVASLKRAAPGPQDRMRVAFSFRVVDKPDNDVLIAQFDMSTSGEQIFVILRDGKLTLAEQFLESDAASDPIQDETIETQLGTTWHRITLTYERGALPKLSLALDAETPVEIAPKFAVGKIVGAVIGSTFAQTGAAASFRFDDVVIETSF